MNVAKILEKKKLLDYGLESMDEKSISGYTHVRISHDILIWTYKNDKIIKVNYFNGMNIVLRIVDLHKFYAAISNASVSAYIFHPKSIFGSFKYQIRDQKIYLEGKYFGAKLSDAQQMLIKFDPILGNEMECSLDKL
jgi:hypothetical protein